MRSSSRYQKQFEGKPNEVVWQIEDGKRPHGKLQSKLMSLVCWRLGCYCQHGKSAWIEAPHKGWKGYPFANCEYLTVDEEHRRSS